MTLSLQALLLLLQRAASEHKLPYFSGYYFTDTKEEFYEVDGCGFTFCTPALLSSSPLDAMLKAAPSYPDCEWNASSLVKEGSSGTWKPNCFVSENDNDWNEIYASPSPEVTQLYTIYCDGNDGKTLYKFTEYVEPWYDCPDNTRRSWDMYTGEKGCTSTPLPCIADVAAYNDETASYVGLVWSFNDPDTQVLEAKPSGIEYSSWYKNGSFVGLGTYWGEKYGIPSNIEPTYDQAVAVIKSGMDQRNYVFTYSDIEYYPGGTDEHPNDCMFGSGSLVYYSYNEGGLSLVPYTGKTDPESIFNALSCGPDPEHFCPVLTNSPYTLPQKNNVTFSFKAVNLMPSSWPVDLTAKADIFNFLRNALKDQISQRDQLPKFVEQFRASNDISVRELAARCLCFELGRLEINDIDHDVKPMLAEVLLEFKGRISDNFPLALISNELSSFGDKPVCSWFTTYIALLSTSDDEQAQRLINLIDVEQDSVAQADIVSSAGTVAMQKLPVEKRCEYGARFQERYSDRSLSTDARNILTVGMWAVKTHSPEYQRAPAKICGV